MHEISAQIGARQSGGRPPVVVDNTFLGPVFQRPLGHGADLVHVFADQICRRTFGSGRRRRRRLARSRGSGQEIARRARHSAGSQHRVDDHAFDGDAVAAHAQVGGERRAGGEFSARASQDAQRQLSRLSRADDPRHAVFERQCESAGSTFGFAVKGGEAEAFRLLDGLQVIKLAVSLGGTETLISHPASTTHSGCHQGNPRSYRDHRCADPNFGRHRGCRRSDCRSRRGARCNLRAWLAFGCDRVTNWARRAVSAAADAGTPAQAPADAVYRHGFVYTVDAEDSVQQAIAIRAGRIVYVGSDAGVAPFIGDQDDADRSRTDAC